MENEILAADIYLHPVKTDVATTALDAEISKVEQALKSYECNASMLDYAAAVISGILAGAVDAFLVGETSLFDGTQRSIQDQAVEIVRKVLVRNTANEKIMKPVMHKAADAGLLTEIPLLEELAKRPTVLGLLAAVAVQISRGGMVIKPDNKRKFLPEGISKEDGIVLTIIAVFVGILKWLSVISSDKNGKTEIRFKTLAKICGLIRSVPAFSAVVNNIEKWQKQLPNEMRQGHKNEESDMGVEKVFCSFFMMLGTTPALKNTNLQKAVQMIQKGKQLGLHQMPVIKSLNRQMFPVLVNEVIVRTFFFGSRLAKELKANEDVNGIRWENVLPFGNRDIDRMMTVSSMTLSIADTADAAIRAAVDSCGDMVMFGSRFVTRFNYVAAGRAAIAIVKEISEEKASEELIHTKRLLTEAKTEKALEIIMDYQQQLEKRVSEYLAEDITAFLEGFDCMDRGMAEKNSDLVIKGNVIIQRVLGREPQFTNQQEFDDLMDSDEALKL